MTDGCVFCDREGLRSAAEVYFENEHCVYASTRDPRDPPDVLPGCGVIVPIEHVTSPFGFSPEQWAATHELLLAALGDARRSRFPRTAAPIPSLPGNGRARSLGGSG